MNNYGQIENPFDLDQIELREKMITALRKNPRSMLQISRDTGIHRIVIKRFGSGLYVSNKVALRLQKYIDELLEKK